MPDLTAEDLRAMAEAKRRARTDDEAGSSLSEVGDEFEFEEFYATCPKCRKNRQVRAPAILHGRLEYSLCPGCRDADEKTEAEEFAEQARRHRLSQIEARRKQIRELIQAAGGNPWEHGAATLDNFDADESGDGPVQAIRKFVDKVKMATKYEPVRGLYLTGDTGNGKTHLAVAAMRELLMDPDFPPSAVRFDHAISLIAKIQDTYRTGVSTEELLEARINARLWILDDLGAERPSEDVVQRLTMIFTERAMRPTLVTSNDMPDRLEQRHPEFKRIQSRLGPAYFRVVEVKGRDRRFDKKAA